MTIDTSKLFLNWKTTAQGLLTLALSLVIAYSSLPAGAKWSVIAVALLKTCISFMQKDAGTQLAITPEGVKPVDSHEIPFDQSATPVK